MARNITARLLNLTRNTPSHGVAHGPTMRVTRQSPTPQRGRGNGVIRAWVVARHQELDPGLAAEEVTLLAIAGGLLLWVLRLSMAPASTLAGFRTWVLEECPVAPGRRAACQAPAVTSGPASQAAAVVPQRGSGTRGGTKTARFLALVTERHGPLAAIPLEAVAKISAAVAPQVELNAGAARAALRRAVLAAQDGDPR
jgi:hypothetical protein